MDRMICTKDLVLFLYSHRLYAFGYLLESVRRAILINIQNILLEVLMQHSSIISHQLSPPERRFRDIQIIIITNFVLLSSVGIKRVSVSTIVTKNFACGLQHNTHVATSHFITAGYLFIDLIIVPKTVLPMILMIL